jgi:hypothetical protein
VKITGVTLGWDLNPTLEFDNRYVLQRSAEKSIYGKYYPKGMPGEWPIDPETGEKVPIGPTNRPRPITRTPALWLFLAALAVLVGAAVVTLASGCATAPNVRSRTMLVDADGVFWNDARCYNLMEQRDAWCTASKFLVGAGGVGAVATPTEGAIDDEQKQKVAQYATGIAAGVTSAAGLAALWMCESKSRELEQYCETAPQPKHTDEPAPTAPMPNPWAEPDGGPQ